MCTVRELIDKLEELDPVVSVYSNGFGGSHNEWVDLDISDYYGYANNDTFDYINLKNNPLATKEEQSQTHLLLLGDC